MQTCAYLIVCQQKDGTSGLILLELYFPRAIIGSVA